ncbi:MAG TPA: hypothetical protein VGE01_09485 [Fimbriimonas sp.]
MLLRGSFDEKIELTVQGYQFPDAKPSEDWHDANWLRVRLRVAEMPGWDASDPALLTTEARTIADWLRKAAVGLSEPTLDFIEPSLTFETYEDEIGDRYYNLVVAPELGPRALVDLACASVMLSLSSDPEALREAADQLEAELEAFPVRGTPVAYWD